MSAVRRSAATIAWRALGAPSSASIASCRAAARSGVGQRLRQPAAQHAAAGGRGAAVEQGEQRGRALAGERLRDFQRAPRGGVETQVLAGRLDMDVAHVRERDLLRRTGIGDQRAGRGEPQRHVLHAERREAVQSQDPQQCALGTCSVELPCRQRPRGYAARARRRCAILGEQQLGRLDAFQRGRGFGERRLGHRQPSGGEVEPRHTGALARRVPRREQALAPRVEQVRVRDRARRDDARDLALERSLRRCRVAELLDDDHRLADLHQAREVLLDGVERHARHRDRRTGRLAPRGQRDVEQPRCALGVVEEQLVEIAHPVEDQLVRMLRLDAQILLHHRRVRGERRAPGRVGRGSRRGRGVAHRRNYTKARRAQMKTEPGRLRFRCGDAT